jgi:hypothetical protein
MSVYSVMLKPLTLVLCALALCAVAATAQDNTDDFSGTWVLDDHPVNVPADLPRRLVVEHPSLRTITVKEYGDDWDQQYSYEISEPNGPRKQATWSGKYLQIRPSQEKRTPAGIVVWRREQTWRLERPGGSRLVIGFVTRDYESAKSETSQTLFYRRNP